MTHDPSEMSLEERIALIRGSLTPLDLADMLELPVTHDKITSPGNPDERTPSCHLYEDGWYDYSTGEHGDVIDLYRRLTGSGLGRTVNRLLEGAQRLDVDPDRVRRTPTVLPDLTDVFMTQFVDTCGLYLDRWVAGLRPLTGRDIILLGSQQMVRYSPDSTTMAIAHWHDGVVRGIKLRTLVGTKTAVPGSTFACGLYRAEKWRYDLAIITEGETDCWALTAASIGADILSLPSGAGLWKDAWLTQLEGYERIFTAFDNDRAGKAATDKVEKAIRNWRPVEGMAYNDRWRQLEVPGGFKDVREALAGGWKPNVRSGW